jgi:YD repeat-containing protein
MRSWSGYGVGRRLAVFAAVLALTSGPASVPASAQTTTTYTYDAFGRLVSVSDVNAGVQTRPVVYEYDPAGNRVRVSNGGGVQEYPVGGWSTSSTSTVVPNNGLNVTGMADGRVTAPTSVHITTSTAGEEWVEADLGDAKTVEEIDIAAAVLTSQGVGESLLNGAVIVASNDRVSWTAPISVSGVAANAYRTIAVGGVSARYWRVRRAGQLALGELRFFSGGRPLPAPGSQLPSVSLSVVISGSVTFRPLESASVGASPQALVSWTQGASGTVAAPGDGRLIYTPTVTTPGTDQFTYKLKDANGVDRTAIVSVSILAVGANRPPSAVADQVQAQAGVAVIFNPLANDSDPDGEPIALKSYTQPASGTLTVNGTQMTYRSLSGFSGVDSFTYEIEDTRRTPATATVTITVGNAVPGPPGNHAPWPMPDYITASPGVPVTFNPADNDGELDGDTMRVTAVQASAEYGNQISVDPQTGLVTYSPWFNYVGQETLTYTVTDQWGASATGEMHFTVVGSIAPVAGADAIHARPGVAKVFDPRVNDTDADGDSLKVTQITAAPGHGAVAISGGGTSITYTAAVGYNGADTFTYRVSDGRGGHATATVTVTVQPNTAPVAANDSFDIPAVGRGSLDPLANDSDFDGDALTVTGITGAAKGIATIEPGGRRILYVAGHGYTGSDTLSYTINDGYGGTANGSLTVNLLPNVVEYLIVGGGGGGGPSGGGGGGGLKTGLLQLPPGPLAITIGAGGVGGKETQQATNGGGSSIGASVSVAGGGAGAGRSGVGAAGGSGGGGGGDNETVAAGGAGTPGEGYGGGIGGGGGSVFVHGGAPGGGGGAGGPGRAGVKGRAGDGGPGVISAISGAALPYAGGGGGRGSYMGGTNALAQDAGAAGDASAGAGGGGGSDTFEGQIDGYPGLNGRGGGGGGAGAMRSVMTGATPAYGRGGSGGSGVVILRYPGPSRSLGGAVTQADGYTIHTFTQSSTFTPAANTAPVAANDVFNAKPGGPRAFDPLRNDVDADGDELFITQLTAAAYGTVVTSADRRTVTYTPNAGYTGPDAFSYTVGDGRGGIATAQVTVNVRANTAPTAANDAINAVGGEPFTFDPRGNDTDPQGDELFIASVSGPGHGTATVSNRQRAVIYTGHSGYTGPDSFTYTVTDDQGETSTATVQVVVQSQVRLFSISPAVGGRTTWNLDLDGSLDLPSGGTWTLTPLTTFTAQVKGWGAGGGASGDSVGGGGGFAGGRVQFQAGEALRLDIGGGGGVGQTHGGDNGTSHGGAPGGGRGGLGNQNGDYPGGGGGGFTSIRRADGAVPVIVAGGGGGGAFEVFSPAVGGAGGGATGQQGGRKSLADPPGGAGGTQTSGAASLQGGVGQGRAGGGGGGYYGGQAGVNDGFDGFAGGGGGGSGYLDESRVSAGALVTGNAATPGEAGDPDRGNAAGNGGAPREYGQAGRLIVVGATTPNSAPTAVNDAVTTDWRTPAAIQPLSNDTDPNGDSLTIASYGAVSQGTLSRSGEVLNYVPVNGFAGPVTFSYTASDGRGGTATASVTITLTVPPNAAPVAANDNVVVEPGQTLTFDPRSNDSDLDGDALTITSVGLPPQGSAAIAAGGGAVTYIPAPGYRGLDSFTYSVSDGRGGTAAATVQVTVRPSVDYLIVAGGGAGTVRGPLSGGAAGGGGGVLTGSTTMSPGSYAVVVGAGGASNTSIDGAASSLAGVGTAIGGGGGGGQAGYGNVNPATIAGRPGGSGGGATSSGAPGAGTPGQGHTGGTHSRGGSGGGAGGPASGTQPGPGLVSMISGAARYYGSGGAAGNGVPTEGGGRPIPWGPPGNGAAGLGGGGAGDTEFEDEEGGIRGTGAGSGGSGVVIVRYRNGAHTASGGTISYVGGYTIHTFPANGSLVINDNAPPNPMPVAQDDTVSTQNGALTFDPRVNDSDPQADPLTISSATPPSHGVVAVNGGVTITYTPTSGYAGSDSFTYTISDGRGGTATATVTVHVGVFAYVEYLVVGGGGGGGSAWNSVGGGGGGGGVKAGGLALPKGSYAITVGGGGASNGVGPPGSNGGGSAFGTLVSVLGGGGGGSGVSAGQAGGSGGGGGAYAAGAAGTSGQGHAGGSYAGGGGGAGAAGGNGAGGVAGNGGVGLSSAISGASQVYGSGGGAGNSPSYGGGGANGGGVYGRGGKGGNCDEETSEGTEPGTGGTGGVVIIRYLAAAGTGTGGAITTSGGYRIHTFTSNGTFVAP